MADQVTPTSGATPYRVPANHLQPNQVRTRHSFEQSHFDELFPGGLRITFSTIDFGDFIYLNVVEYAEDYLTEELLSEAFVEDFARFDVDFWRLFTAEA